MAKKENKYWTKIKKATRFVEHDIWRIPLSELSPRKTFLIRQLRILILAVRGFVEDKVHVRASALTYYTLFGMVPIIGMFFGVAKGFGLEKYLEIQLRQAFSGREEVLDWVLEFSQSILETASGGIVAGIGIVILLYTVMIILNFIEESFNEIWQVKKPRPWSRKFSDYFAMMFITPLFFILASATTVFLRTEAYNFVDSMALGQYFSPAILFVANLAPYLLVWIMFLILYVVMPNTNVKFKSALIAAIIAGTLFQITQWYYIYFQVGVSRYNAIYGSFAALPLLMFFIRISWLIVLFGAEISYANQNVENYEFDAESQHISPFNKKLLALYVLHLLIGNFMKGGAPMTSEQIAHQLQIPNKLVRSILNDLTDVSLLSETKTKQAKEVGFLPSMDPNQINVRLVLDRLDRKGVDILIAKPSKELDKLKEILKKFHERLDKSSENVLLKEI
jgi:membrane protein